MELAPEWGGYILDYVNNRDIENVQLREYMKRFFPKVEDFLMHEEQIKGQLYPALDNFVSKGIERGKGYEIWKQSTLIKKKHSKLRKRNNLWNYGKSVRVI